jgi:citrate lyase subunit beta/citryl-CoA lyase
MLKSLALQAEMAQEFATCVFDVTLDCEDGAAVGKEKDHALLVQSIAKQAYCASQAAGKSLARVATRVHPVDHPAFEQDVEIIVGGAAQALCHVMIPKVESRSDVDRAVQVIDRAALSGDRDRPMPIHVLIESALAVQQVADIVSHPRVESASFGLMDFVSAHGGSIPASAMGMSASADAPDLDQFSHPLVVRAKLEIAAACHAYGKVASHCVVTEFRDSVRLGQAAKRASQALGYGRMWSIHPNQIRPILAAFAPADSEVDQASEIICKAHAKDWAPISMAGQLHDRASYRYYWQVLMRARQTARLHVHDPAQVFFDGR